MNSTERDQKIEELKAEHGRIYACEHEGRLLVFRKPSPGEYDRFTDMILDEAKRKHATKMLVQSCVVYPSGEEFAAVCKDYVALPTEVLGPIQKLAKGELRELGKD